MSHIDTGDLLLAVTSVGEVARLRREDSEVVGVSVVGRGPTEQG